MKNIKYSPDEAGGGSFLDEDLSGVDTSMPLVKEGIYELKVDEIEKIPNKAEDGELLKFKFKTTSAMESVDGQPIAEGYTLFHQISITPTEKYTKDAIKRNVAAFVQAAGGTHLMPLEQWKGKIVQAKVKVQGERTNKETGESYPPRNEIKSFVKPD